MADARAVVGGLWKNRTDMFVAVGVIAVVMMMIIPLPAVLLDVLMTVNLVLSLLVILMVLYTRHALEFSVFPTLLLVTTVFGLALNVSSTRLILSKGSRFDGRIIRAFGTFVVGSRGLEGYVIGFIIFIIIIAVQFIVITKGATRVAEVAARFTLDALPGKQMAIEAEYNSGLITEEEATRRKNDLQREADFYGAMDGASKFISGSVKVGILITIVNIIGGMVVGMTIHGESWQTAIDTYVSLTIGDGLVTQLPALLISTATGIIVTRAVSDSSFGKDITKQFSANSRPYLIAGAFLIVLAFLPGFPWYVLIPMGALIGALGFSLARRHAAEEEKVKGREVADREKAAPAEISPVVPLDPLSLEIGYGLIPLVDKEQGAELLDRITRIRRESALELGLVVPRIRIIDNMRLEPAEYSFKIRGVEVGRGRIKMGHFLAIRPGKDAGELPGEPTKDPAFGLAAVWITEQDREKAERMGCTVVDPPSIIATHLTEILKRHAAEVLGRQEVQSILDTLKTDYSAVVEEVRKSLSTGEIQKVLQGLLAERVSVRNMVVILETLADYAGVTKDSAFLVEKVRQALGRQISLQYCDEAKTLRVLTIEPSLEKRIIDSRVETGRGVAAALEPALHRRWITALSNAVRAVQEQGYHEVVLCSEAARPLVKASSAREIPHLAVLSSLEVASDITVESLGEIRVEATEPIARGG
ncbi:MAG: flagellar biosynthesis protein FlhA [Spirochaetes bacterium RBG_13_68_11]|nr:MAG: flagellar biosynthesis protein FlhA [Spirochaetes bacterium RBG_13_68_11]